MQNIKTVEELREYYIKLINEDKSQMSYYADDLYTLDLTVYSSNNNFNSMLYNSLAQSEIDEEISLHPEQLKILQTIKDNSASIISAPTSFGKTFCIFEYIAREKPKNVVLIVPTLALIDEYTKKIIKKYLSTFGIYKVHTTIDENKTYDFNNYNLFILTHDRIVQQISYEKIEKIDFLVIDEVYKLQKDESDDRVIVLNMAYDTLAKKSEKYVLLAPFIKEIKDRSLLDKNPKFFGTNYSPVVNDVKTIEITDDSERFGKTLEILNEIQSKDTKSKTLIYFPTVEGLYDFIEKNITPLPIKENLPSEVKEFLDWAKKEIHEEWALVKAIERGFLVHNGQIPLGTRMFQLDCFEEYEQNQTLLCTSTLLEGVNTRADSIIITKPSRYSNTKDLFTAFDFFNLVGRTGRLKKHLVGCAYYLKGLEDIKYEKGNAIREVQFEITSDSKDIKIQKEQIFNEEDVKNFLKALNISIKDYKENIGVKLRFDNVVKLYKNYLKHKEELISILNEYLNNPILGRYKLILVLNQIILKEEARMKSILIAKLLNKNRLKLKNIIDETKTKIPALKINFIISSIIKLKYSYIEHSFFNGTSIIKFFLQNDGIEDELLNVINDKILYPIEYIYFNDKKYKRMLIDIGIYERDIDKILKVIGTNYYDTIELKNILKDNLHKLPKDLSYVSRYVIENL